MKVIDEARNCARSNTDGMGHGTRRGIVKVVHLSPLPLDGKEPLRAKSWTETTSY